MDSGRIPKKIATSTSALEPSSQQKEDSMENPVGKASSKVEATSTQVSEAPHLTKREIQVSPRAVEPTSAAKLNVARRYLSSAIAYFVAWSGTELGADVTKIISKLPKVLPKGWNPFESMDEIGFGNLLRLSTHYAKTTEKVRKLPSLFDKSISAYEKTTRGSKKRPVEQKLLDNVFEPATILGTASAASGGLKVAKNGLGAIAKAGSYVGLFADTTVETLESGKDAASTLALRIVGPLLAYALYRDFLNLFTYHQRAQAFSEQVEMIKVNPPSNEIGSATSESKKQISFDEVPYSRYLKECEPELYRLVKRVAKFQSGTSLWSKLSMDVMRITSYVMGVYFGGKAVADVSLGTIANSLMVLVSCISILQYGYNQRCAQTTRATLQKWEALAPELKNPSLAKDAKESLRAREKRQFIASGFIELKRFEKKGISLREFEASAVKKYLVLSAKKSISDSKRIKEVGELLKADPIISKKYTPQERHAAAMCLVVKPDQYRTKKITKYFALAQAQGYSRTTVRKDVEELLQDKAKAMKIKLDSKYAIATLYKKLSTLKLENYPKAHPLRRILELDEEFLEAIHEEKVHDPEAAKIVLSYALGL